MIVRLLLLTAIAVSVVAGDFFKPEYKNEISLDKDMMYKQKKIFKVLYHLNQPELNTALYSAGMEYNVEAHADDYTNKTVVKDFLRLMNAGFLPHDTVFSIYYPQTMKETLTVFRLMYFAKDWDTFYKTSLFLRNKLNHGVFAYAFYLAVMHRPDTKYMKLPAMYELFPHMFYNVEFMEKTHHFKEFGKFMPKYQSDYDAYVIPYNYSNYYLSDEYDYEQRLNYFTEDIGLNDYYFHFRNNFPFFMSGEEFGMTKNYRGEEYLYGHQMLFNRYFLERLSNELGHVEDYDYDAKFYAGYWPTMSYPNGMHFPSRQWDSYFPKSKFHMINRAEEFESRISQAVDSGIAITKEGKTAKMYDPEGLNMLGNMIEGNADSINKHYYGNVEMLSRKILGFNLDPLTPEKLHPSALEHDSTTLRDPAFWRITKRFLHFYKEYKNHLGPYKTEEIEYPLLKIDDVHVDKLETFFDDYESWVSSNLAVSNFAEANRSFILARQKRLNHKPFNVQINITNNYSNKKAAIRIFLGPKYNPHYREIDFRDHHDEFYEMDSFIYDLSPGVNVVKRHCHDFFFVAEDPKPSSLLYDSIVKAAEGDLKFEKRIHAFPLRMLLPKGRPDGMPFQLFVHVAPVESEPVLYTSNVFGDSLLDSRPLGYPLDRPLDPWGFKAPNFFFKDVLIYHPSDYWYQH